jgi:hypothetical protein
MRNKENGDPVMLNLSRGCRGFVLGITTLMPVNIKSEALNTLFLFKKLLSVEIYYNRIKRMNTEYT